MIMNRTLDNNSTLLPTLFVILTGFVERPVVAVKPFVDLIAWMRRASLPYTPTADVLFVTFQAGPDCPFIFSRSYKEIEIRGAFQLEHLQTKVIFYQTKVLPLSPN